MSTERAPKDQDRLAVVDVMRGVAVVLMILWHTAQAWIATRFQTGAFWDTLRLLGGLAAPSFLFLAGMGVGLKAISDQRRGVPRAHTAIALAARGAEIVFLGYVLRLQMWAIDSGGLFHSGLWRVATPAIIGVALAVVGLRRLAKLDIASSIVGAGGIAWLVLALYQLSEIAPRAIVGALRVDVLQAIGVAIAVVALLGSAINAFRRERIWILVVAATILALCVHRVALMLPGSLPVPLAGYLAQWAVPVGAPRPTLFPIIPWVCYALVGSATSVVWARSRHLGRTLFWYAACGAMVAVATSESWSWTFTVRLNAPDIIPLLRVVHRIGCVYVLFALALLLGRFSKPLHTLGQASLLVYWVHLEFAFGIAAWWARDERRGALDPFQWFLGFVALTTAMWAMALLRGSLRRGPIKKWMTCPLRKKSASL